jgi:WD40 repeat protein
LRAWDSSDFSIAPIVINSTLDQLIHDRWLLIATADGGYSLWDLSQPAAPMATAVNFGFSESQNWFYYYDEENTLRLLDLKSAAPKPLEVGRFDGPNAPTLSANDQWLAIAANDGASTLIYDLTQNLAKSELPDVTPFNFSPDGRWLALQDAQQNMVLYDLQTRTQLPAKYPNSYGFQQISPDGRWAVGGLATNAYTDMLLIDLNNPEKFYTLTGHTDSLNGKYFTPDQRGLLTYGYDGTVRVWDLENPTSDPVVLSHGEIVWNAQLSENGRRLIVNTDKNVYIWQWDFNAVHDLACRLVGRNLTQAEWEKYVGGEYHKTCDQWP